MPTDVRRRRSAVIAIGLILIAANVASTGPSVEGGADGEDPAQHRSWQPEPPQLVHPPSATTDVDTPVRLEWIAPESGEVSGYHVFIGRDESPPADAIDHQNTTYEVDWLHPNTTYYWRIQVVYTDGGYAMSDLWTFTTAYGRMPPAADFSDWVDHLNLTVYLDGSPTMVPSGEAALYSWDFGDGSAATGQAAVHTYAAPGPYVVALNVTTLQQGLSDEHERCVHIAIRVAFLCDTWPLSKH